MNHMKEEEYLIKMGITTRIRRSYEYGGRSYESMEEALLKIMKDNTKRNLLDEFPKSSDPNIISTVNTVIDILFKYPEVFTRCIAPFVEEKAFKEICEDVERYQALKYKNNFTVKGNMGW